MLDQTGVNNPAFKGFYITPWGRFAATTTAVKAGPLKVDCMTLRAMCERNDRIITQAFVGHNKLLDKSDIGKTFADIGYNFQER